MSIEAKAAEAGLLWFNTLTEEAARAELTACLAVPRWVSDVAGGRPYRLAGDAVTLARLSAARMSESEMDDALARHPRIGDTAGDGHDVDFSRQEQRAMEFADIGVRNAIEAANAAYEKRFGRVFLIRARKRSPVEILTELNRRLANDEAAEMAEVIGQLGEIAVGRLEQLLNGPPR
jgi:2-oxo-4-hydroxy-4-carboxy-5-ureidoimidazoline decarboxylase